MISLSWRKRGKEGGGERERGEKGRGSVVLPINLQVLR